MSKLTQTEELAALEEIVAAFPGLDEQIAALHAKQREWLEANPDAMRPSPVFEILCDLEDLRDLHAEHLAVLSALAVQRGSDGGER